MDILVAYATCHGSTRSIAERIGGRLSACGFGVDVRSAASVERAWDYDAAVVGSAIHNGDWLPEGAEFLHRHAVALSGRPVWLFNVSMAPVLHGRRGRWLAERAPVPHAVGNDRGVLNPRDLHTFAGVLERTHIPVPSRLFVRLFGEGFGDFRDWEDIDSWAYGIAETLAAEEDERAGGDQRSADDA